MSLPEIILILFVSCFSALGVLWVFTLKSKRAKPAPIPPQSEPISFLFRGGYLDHASDPALTLLGESLEESDWATMRAALSQRFMGIPTTPPLSLERPLILAPRGAGDQGALSLSMIKDCVHIEVQESDALPADILHHIATQSAEFDLLQKACETTPFPVWFVDKAKRVKWHNKAYEVLYRSAFEQPVDCEKPLFVELLKADEPTAQNRMSLTPHDTSEPLWFGVAMVNIDGGYMFHASDINAVITAEIAQRNFVQTLAKTFAQLSTGLAIFDRNGLLALFNPALVDLTVLPADFLSARPDLSSFFDRLRENRVMPEPKNYRSWREQIAEVISAATDGRYEEIWTLETGQTYRVIGRPHPDGAIAFLIEDISAETLITRNFRQELEINQSIMNALEDGLAVFSSGGILQFSNDKYGLTWGLSPETSFAQITINDSIREWGRGCQADIPWDDVREFVMKVGARTTWSFGLNCPNGNALRCYMVPIAAGSTLFRFELDAPALTPKTEITHT